MCLCVGLGGGLPVKTSGTDSGDPHTHTPLGRVARAGGDRVRLECGREANGARGGFSRIRFIGEFFFLFCGFEGNPVEKAARATRRSLILFIYFYHYYYYYFFLILLFFMRVEIFFVFGFFFLDIFSFRDNN